MQFKGKLMIETWQNGKSLISGPILARLWHIWGPEILFVSFTSTSSYTLFQAIILCNFIEN